MDKFNNNMQHSQHFNTPLAATQSQSTDFWYTPIESEPFAEASQIWGQLQAKKINSECVDLKSETFAVGRGDDNNLILNSNLNIPQKILCRISKQHFVLSRLACSEQNPAYLKDISRHGTFVNSVLIGRNNQCILQNDDVISLVDPCYKAFVFKDLSAVHNLDFPNEINSEYYVGRILGTGGFGQVHLVYKRCNCQQFAMKIVRKNNANLAGNSNLIFNEIKILKNLAHPCIIHMHDILDHLKAVYMILEFMQGGDLLQRIASKGVDGVGGLSENVAKLYFFQMCQALKYLHGNGICHRDIKPENILLKSNSDETLLKLTDFGLSKIIESGIAMHTVCGTELYVAPEILTANGGQCPAYTNKVDIWSLAVVLFISLSGTLPFKNNNELLKAQFTLYPHIWENVSSSSMSLIKQMLNANPVQRPSIDIILKCCWFEDEEMLQVAKMIMETELHDAENNDEISRYTPPPKN